MSSYLDQFLGKKAKLVQIEESDEYNYIDFGAEYAHVWGLLDINYSSKEIHIQLPSENGVIVERYFELLKYVLANLRDFQNKIRVYLDKMYPGINEEESELHEIIITKQAVLISFIGRTVIYGNGVTFKQDANDVWRIVDFW